jgi:hypothetical protein
MTSRLVRAFDRSRSQPRQAAPAPAPHLVLRHRVLPIREALEWAFGVERAGLDFDEAKGDNARPGVSPIWVLMQRGALGCRIDGGGWNAPARDADIIASAVAHLPPALGGRRMALRVAELARAGLAEDWGQDLVKRCIPVGWRGENQYGPSAETVLVGHEKVVVRGRERVFPVYACPVTYTATEDRIRAARRGYADWVAALDWLGNRLRAQGALDRVTISAGLPEAAPWARGAKTFDNRITPL